MDQRIIIVSIPEAATDSDVTEAFGAQFEDGFYHVCNLPPQDGNLRFMFRETKRRDPAELAAKEADDIKARAILRANPYLTQVRTVALLAAAGIRRSCNWVGLQRALMVVKTQ